jgi:hypothetical protein
MKDMSAPAPIGTEYRLLAALALLGAFAAAEAAVVHHYRITVDPSMSRMAVEARFGTPVDTVTAKSEAAGKYLAEAWDCGDASRIRMRNRRMMLPYADIRCMNYTVDLDAAARSAHYNRALAAANRVVSPSLWLWRPKLSSAAEIHVRFELPPGMQVSVPWPQLGADEHAFRLTGSPESADAPAVFGRFDYSEIDVPGARLRVSLLAARDGNGALTPEAIRKWIRASATDVSLAYGRFPNPSPQVVIVPVGSTAGGSGAVPFGRVIRDGGESVELFVDQRQPAAELFGDWTATHEFSHLMLPYVSQQHRWVSEGFAQYYQNVLLARSGAYDPLTAWQKLWEGFERGRLSRPELSPNTATDRGNRSARMKVYWSGAAIALMADVTLRERSGGKQTLDDIMGALQDCCLPSDRVWSGTELFEKLDTLAGGSPVFMPLYRRYADTAGFPDTRGVFARLGISIEDRRVRYRQGDLQALRGAIMKTDVATAAWRERLARNQRAPAYASGSGGAH